MSERALVKKAGWSTKFNVRPVWRRSRSKVPPPSQFKVSSDDQLVERDGELAGELRLGSTGDSSRTEASKMSASALPCAASSDSLHPTEGPVQPPCEDTLEHELSPKAHYISDTSSPATSPTSSPGASPTSANIASITSRFKPSNDSPAASPTRATSEESRSRIQATSKALECVTSGTHERQGMPRNTRSTLQGSTRSTSRASNGKSDNVRGKSSGARSSPRSVKSVKEAATWGSSPGKGVHAVATSIGRRVAERPDSHVEHLQVPVKERNAVLATLQDGLARQQQQAADKLARYKAQLESERLKTKMLESLNSQLVDDLQEAKSVVEQQSRELTELKQKFFNLQTEYQSTTATLGANLDTLCAQLADSINTSNKQQAEIEHMSSEMSELSSKYDKAAEESVRLWNELVEARALRDEATKENIVLKVKLKAADVSIEGLYRQLDSADSWSNALQNEYNTLLRTVKERAAAGAAPGDGDNLEKVHLVDLVSTSTRTMGQDMASHDVEIDMQAETQKHEAPTVAPEPIRTLKVRVKPEFVAIPLPSIPASQRASVPIVAPILTAPGPSVMTRGPLNNQSNQRTAQAPSRPAVKAFGASEDFHATLNDTIFDMLFDTGSPTAIAAAAAQASDVQVDLLASDSGSDYSSGTTIVHSNDPYACSPTPSGDGSARSSTSSVSLSDRSMQMPFGRCSVDDLGDVSRTTSMISMQELSSPGSPLLLNTTSCNLAKWFSDNFDDGAGKGVMKPHAHRPSLEVTPRLFGGLTAGVVMKDDPGVIVDEQPVKRELMDSLPLNMSGLSSLQWDTPGASPVSSRKTATYAPEASPIGATDDYNPQLQR